VNFRVGAKVREKRPEMRVVKVSGDTISCRWTDPYGTEQERNFDAKDLEFSNSRGFKPIIRG
jgi:uncharacterized protein YodC (DUF2158 family)